MLRKNNWCPEIFRSLYVDRVNNDQIKIAPCCQAKQFVAPVDTFDFYTDNNLSKLRKKFLLGERPTECNSCWKVEDLGHKSRRISAIEFYNLEDYSSDVVLESLDYSSTWSCNLACIMCSPASSSTWATEENLSKNQLRIIGRLNQKENSFVEKINVSAIKKIHINGGEPFINNDHLVLLNQMDQQGLLKNLFVSYNTNGTKFPSSQAISMWSKARLVKIFLSIDATDQAFNYIRWPAKWDEVNQNIVRMKKELPSNVMFGLNVTVGSYNLLELPDVIDWFESTIATNREGDPSDVNWQFSIGFDPSEVNARIKHSAIERFNNYKILNSISNYLEQKTVSNDNWIKKLNAIDKKRNTDWKSSLKISNFLD